MYDSKGNCTKCTNSRKWWAGPYLHSSIIKDISSKFPIHTNRKPQILILLLQICLRKDVIKTLDESYGSEGVASTRCGYNLNLQKPL